jgi:hypothetical protein
LHVGFGNDRETPDVLYRAELSGRYAERRIERNMLDSVSELSDEASAPVITDLVRAPPL